MFWNAIVASKGYSVCEWVRVKVVEKQVDKDFPISKWLSMKSNN